MSKAIHFLASDLDGRSSLSGGRILQRQSENWTMINSYPKVKKCFLNLEKVKLCFVLIQLGLLNNLRGKKWSFNWIWLETHLVKKLAALSELEDNEQKVGRVDHILNNDRSKILVHRERYLYTSKLMIHGWLTDWRIRTSFKTDVELRILNCHQSRQINFK